MDKLLDMFEEDTSHLHTVTLTMANGKYRHKTYHLTDAEFSVFFYQQYAIPNFWFAPDNNYINMLQVESFTVTSPTEKEVTDDSHG